MGETNMKPKQEFTHEEVLGALHMIKQVCASRQDCAECPFYDNICIIQSHAPQEWKIKEGTVWRAFE